MTTPIYYIIPNPLYSPKEKFQFRAFMDIENQEQFLPCWHDRIKALDYLESKFGTEGEFGVILSSLESVQAEITLKSVPVKIKFMD